MIDIYPAGPDPHDDLLSPEQIRRLTGVPKRAQNGIVRQINVLQSAGIHHWLRDDGTLATTWHHVHNARPPNDEDENETETSGPRFETVT